MRVGVVKESLAGETRVAMTPLIVKKLKKLNLDIAIEAGAGAGACIRDQDYTEAGAQIVDSTVAWQSDIVLKIQPPTDAEIGKLKAGNLLISLLAPYDPQGAAPKLAAAKVDAIALELIPRTSRAQSMDVLSSQAGIAGYRAVVEAARLYVRFMPMMMTSAGMAKPAKAIVLGAGVAGLQAIASLRKLGAQVEAYDVRPEVKEQIESLGAKFIDLDVGESGSGTGGYAKELSEDAKKKQQELLTKKLQGADIIVTTANVPGRKAPVLITEEAVKGMRTGSVIIDMAAPTGGNCPLTELDKVVTKHGVILVGVGNYPALVPFDASQFFAGNMGHLLGIMIESKDGKAALKMNFEDDILNAACLCYKGEMRKK